jgi:endonuclease-3
VAAGTHDVRHWHIDYLLGHPAVRLDSVRTSTGVDAECAVARALPGDRVGGFGASDCRCDSHLAYAAERAELSQAIERVHAQQQ